MLPQLCLRVENSCVCRSLKHKSLGRRDQPSNSVCPAVGQSTWDLVSSRLEVVGKLHLFRGHRSKLPRIHETWCEKLQRKNQDLILHRQPDRS